MSLRKAPPSESKFAQFITPTRKASSDTRATVLLRLDPKLLERIDKRVDKERRNRSTKYFNRHQLIVELLEISLKT